MVNAESAASAAKVMYLQRKMVFEKNATNCKNYFKDGCSYPWCDMCGGYEQRKVDEMRRPLGEKANGICENGRGNQETERKATDGQ